MTARSCSCGARIVFAVTEHGKRMPVDELPAADGNVELEERAGGVLLARVLGKSAAAAARDAGRELYTSHFATCPDAVAYRQRKSKRNR